ncbi:hypothetical protein IFM47457_11169 [Aspergillus lentulus]|nr:hypothetical protein IFM47457_11169 [Aspergillus lentulus]
MDSRIVRDFSTYDTLLPKPFIKVLYTYSAVVPVLAAVETSPTALHGSSDENSETNNDKPADEKRSTLRGAASKPSPTGLITVGKCLEQHLGHWYRYRGLSMALAYRLAKAVLIYLTPLSPLRDNNIFQWFLYNAAIETSLSILQVALVHNIISRPSHQRFYQYIPGLSSWVTIAPIATLSSTLASANFYFPIFLIRQFGKAGGAGSITSTTESYTIGITLLATALLFFLGVAPTRAIFIRQAASLLPEHIELAVPFDHTFGGKVVPVALGGSGRLNISDAWVSFTFAGRVRYFGILGKAFVLMMTGWFLLFFITMPLGYSVLSALDINFLA